MLKLEQQNYHKRDKCISFQEIGHLYTINDTLISDNPLHSVKDQSYTSVTTFIHQLFPKFDPDVIIPKMMKSKNWPNSPYFGMKPNAIKAQWAANGKAASEAGTKMHEDIELYYNDVEIQNDSIEFEYFNNYLKDHSEFTPYRTEWTVWDKDSHICGSVDMIYIKPPHWSYLTADCSVKFLSQLSIIFAIYFPFATHQEPHEEAPLPT